MTPTVVKTERRCDSPHPQRPGQSCNAKLVEDIQPGSAVTVKCSRCGQTKLLRA